MLSDRNLRSTPDRRRGIESRKSHSTVATAADLVAVMDLVGWPRPPLSCASPVAGSKIFCQRIRRATFKRAGRSYSMKRRWRRSARQCGSSRIQSAGGRGDLFRQSTGFQGPVLKSLGTYSSGFWPSGRGSGEGRATAVPGALEPKVTSTLAVECRLLRPKNYCSRQ